MKKVMLSMAVVGLLLVGCNNEGPLEKAGKQMDQAIEDAGDAIEDAAEEVEEAVEDEMDDDHPVLDSIEAKSERAGEKIGNALNKLKKDD